MRRSIILLLALIFTLAGTDTLHAQQNGSTRLGLKGGLNFAEFEIDDEDDPEQDSRTGFIGGAYLTFRADEFISFQPEVLYSQTGTSVDFPGAETEFELSYIQVPVLALFNFSPGSTIRPHLALGPYIAFNIGCDIEVEFAGGSGEADCDEDEEFGTDVFDAESIDWGGVFGGGLNFHGSRGVLTVDGRYNLGLADVFEDGEGDPDADDSGDVMNRFWSVMIGFSIPFGGM